MGYRVQFFDCTPDVTAAMLVGRKTAKKSFGNLSLLLCKTCAAFFYCFGTNMAVLSRECNQRIRKLLWKNSDGVILLIIHFQKSNELARASRDL